MTLERREHIVLFLKSLREEIIEGFQKLESKGSFERKTWWHHSGGGGEISLLRGEVFEKAAVNWSGVSGDKFPMQDSYGPFFATGISLITHMMNPHAPTVHMNIRYIETQEKTWFGGGYDLTPMGFPYEEDTTHFHHTAETSLEKYPGDLYKEFSKNAKEYFFIPHWKKERGVGGIFFDHFNTNDFEEDLKMWKNIGKTFLNAILPIYQKRINQPYNSEDREIQLKMRASLCRVQSFV